ncbi:MAG TPA: DUF2520 domain-containing protein [Bacteroides mediterraneensis]|mgnify:CR=1 FL=1|uniref:Rossmann-like and DUF2520 domain-containing protein n=1 Tax=Bacteroides mediterraneensis TaxID=1841856 RepID=UPI00262FC987|nr:DUF2520 domain-containing protein [Bacteroides mediterraneensis]HJH65557.1 DUF2520 domain-containing protein [Bacteroides mediterraneensis]
MMNTKKKSIVCIGAGNVATHISKALQQKGFRLQQVYSRTENSARTLADILGCKWTNQLAQVYEQADVYIVSVKDAVLETVIDQLAHCNPDALYLHTAGSMPMEVWEGKQKNYGVAYPMQTFSKQREVRIEEVPFFIEANSTENLSQLREIAESLSPKVYEATSAQRKYLHIAAVFACNFSNHMYAICEHLLTTHQLPFETMLPLIDETARKVHKLPPVEAQTGPARRYDENVIHRHLDMLKEEEPQLAKIYQLLSQHIHQYENEKQK